MGPYTLNDPLVYVLGGEGFVDEVSCIDPGLPIGKPAEEPPGGLGYFPEYSRLSPAQRANYLQWLAKERSGPLSDIGYAFLFFYGLERRLILEGKDLNPIAKEVVRLLETYKRSASFVGPLSRFLSYSLARAGIAIVKEKWFEAVFERTRAHCDEQHLAVGLAWLFSRQRPLPAHWALRIARLDPRAPRNVVLERLREQFDALFVKRYREQHGDGLLLRVTNRDREIRYRPASPALSDEFASSANGPTVRIPNVLGVKSQFSPLVQIWGRCLEELKPLSRTMAKGGEVKTRVAYEALPDDLKADSEHPDKPAWERLVAEKGQEDGTVIVEAGELGRLHGMAWQSSLTIKQSGSLVETANAVGFVIEPDARVTRRPYGWGESVALFRPEQKPSLPTDARYPGAALLLELGMSVAAADGEIEEEEIGHITGFLESQFLLNPTDARRLKALKRLFLKQHPLIGGIGKRLKAILAVDQLESIGEFLVGVAATNGTIAKKQVVALRSAYRALEIDVECLERLLEPYRRLETEPVEVQPETKSTDAGETIPPRSTTGLRPTLRLDATLVERLMHETREVALLLDEAMLEEQPAEETSEVKPSPLSKPAADPRFEGLVVRYCAVLTELCTRPSWTRSDFERLVRNHSLMPSGTLDVINEWSQDRFDELIIEDVGDELIVHADLVVEEL